MRRLLGALAFGEVAALDLAGADTSSDRAYRRSRRGRPPLHFHVGLARRQAPHGIPIEVSRRISRRCTLEHAIRPASRLATATISNSVRLRFRSSTSRTAPWFIAVSASRPARRPGNRARAGGRRFLDGAIAGGTRGELAGAQRKRAVRPWPKAEKVVDRLLDIVVRQCRGRFISASRRP